MPIVCCINKSHNYGNGNINVSLVVISITA